uniref:Uncharacterized protein n=1 Tax=Anguilla anguilla TaxID=7936 RepID=A0A0E9Q1Z7_ANGAN
MKLKKQSGCFQCTKNAQDNTYLLGNIL